MSPFNSDELEHAIAMLEMRLRLHRTNEYLTREEHAALHKVRAVREGLAVVSPSGYLH